MTERIVDDTQATKERQSPAIQIIVNGTPSIAETDIVSYEEVVALAYPVPPSPNTRFTVTFRHAQAPKEGSLVPGRTVEVKHHGTIFNVKATGRS